MGEPEGIGLAALVNGKIKVYQFWERKSVPPLGRESPVRRGKQTWNHPLVWERAAYGKHALSVGNCDL